MFSSVIWDSRYGSDITVASPPAVLWMTPTVAISAEDWKHLPSFYTVINSTASLASLPSMKLRVCVCVCVRVCARVLYVCVSLQEVLPSLALRGINSSIFAWSWMVKCFLPTPQPQTQHSPHRKHPGKSISLLGPLIFFQAQLLIHFTLCLFVTKTLYDIWKQEVCMLVKLLMTSQCTLSPLAS